MNSRTIERLTEKATLDKLTGLLNKASGTERAAALCESSIGSLMILNLDSFKLVNDLYGHDMGDRVLTAFADIVKHSIREDDVVCRIGGDEFLAFFNNITDKRAVEALSKRFNEQFFKVSEQLMGKDFNIPI